MYKPAHYLALFIAISLGVAVGNLSSSYISAQYVAYQANQAAKQFQKERAQQQEYTRQQIEEANERRKASNRAQLELDKKQRIASAAGIKLRRSCLDWEMAYKQLNTETTKKKMDQSCMEYDRYIHSGR